MLRPGSRPAGQGRDAAACSTFWGFPCPLLHHPLHPPGPFSLCRGWCLVSLRGGSLLCFLMVIPAPGQYCSPHILSSKLLSCSLISWSPRLPVVPRQSRSLAWHWVTAPRRLQGVAGDGMGWDGGMMKPGTGDWGWRVITVLVLSLLWPGALWHGFGPCIEGDTAAWVL